RRRAPEALARVVECKQDCAAGAAPRAARMQVLVQAERSIAVDVQEFEILREILGLDVVISENRDLVPRQRGARDECGVASARDARERTCGSGKLDHEANGARATRAHPSNLPGAAATGCVARRVWLQCSVGAARTRLLVREFRWNESGTSAQAFRCR